MYLRDCWYVAAWDHEVGREPVSRTFLGEPVVLYRRADGAPVALEDRCCHRNLPLSMGRVRGDDIQCGYHGLTFDAAGKCILVPGQATIPPGAAVRSYPVVERHRWIWIWMGDPARADEASIPDLFWNGGAEWRSTGDYHRVAAEYRLLTDIQLDATHVTFVHPDTLGSDAVQDTPPKVELADGRIAISRWLLGVEAPPIWKTARDFVGPVDRWILATFLPPTGCVFDIGAADAGTGAPEGDRRSGITNRTSHFSTPEGESSCHYFWLFARNYRLDDEDLDARLHPGVRRTFREDVDAVEAQQRGIDASPGATQIDVNADRPTIQARRLLAGLIEDEERAYAVAPAE